MDALGKILHVNLFGYSHWFMSIRVSQLEENYISVYQYRYSTSAFAKYLDTAKIKQKSKFDKNTLPHDMIFTK